MKLPGPRKKEQAAVVRDAEHRGGCEIWRSLKVVVSLSLNMRSAGMLSRILQEMRAGEEWVKPLAKINFLSLKWALRLLMVYSRAIFQAIPVFLQQQSTL